MACSHFESFKSECGLDNYDTIYSSFVISTVTPEPSYMKNLSCFDCEDFQNERLMACIHCIYFGCYEQHFSGHATRKNHNIFVEISRGNVFCSLCKDYIYDKGLDEIAKKYEKYNTGYTSWKPTEEESKLLKEHSRRVKVDPTTSTGMKGIINLGNTCFMNCIVQAFLHTPLLRDYFFTDRHKCHKKKPADCLFCLFAKLYQTYYDDDDPTTISLHEILYLVWKNDVNLYGYNQKDAHEFFITSRNLLHQTSSPSCQAQEEPCDCIIDKIFRGNLQSDVVCLNCSNVSTKIDPLWEISLDIPDSSSQGGLVECLHNFTLPEPLGSSAKINCIGCKRNEEATKQLTFKLLPLILVIQLKRFAYVKGNYQKKPVYIQFPFDLDMSPYLSSQKKDSQSSTSTSVQSDDFTDNRYSLYAVIVHKGTLHGGHYISYVRRTNKKWFKCDDLSVFPVDEEEVLASEGYLLFYHKTMLPYEGSQI